MTWTRSLDGHITLDARHRWRIRGPIFGRRHFWLYCDGQRYSPTGRYADVLWFTTVRQAKAFVARQETL
jgi:hypothetical protein